MRYLAHNSAPLLALLLRTIVGRSCGVNVTGIRQRLPSIHAEGGEKFGAGLLRAEKLVRGRCRPFRGSLLYTSPPSASALGYLCYALTRLCTALAEVAHHDYVGLALATGKCQFFAIVRPAIGEHVTAGEPGELKGFSAGNGLFPDVGGVVAREQEGYRFAVGRKTQA